MPMATSLELQNTKKCDICGKKADDPVFFGDKFTKSGVTVHNFCLLLSSNLPQNGCVDDDILGFLIPDIKKEIMASKTRFCMYCNETGASIKCNFEPCNKYFHLTCGSVNYCQHEFIGEFKSYCHKHIKVKINEKSMNNISCRICYNQIHWNPINSIKANCCGFGWVDSLCLKKYALSAGKNMKCLWCKSSEFCNQIRYQGIFVPNRDAAWKSNISDYESSVFYGTEQCLKKNLELDIRFDIINNEENLNKSLFMTKLYHENVNNTNDAQAILKIVSTDTI